jgi:hypothetical protein
MDHGCPVTVIQHRSARFEGRTVASPGKPDRNLSASSFQNPFRDGAAAHHGAELAALTPHPSRLRLDTFSHKGRR